MTLHTFATLFQGGGGADLGLSAAGLQHAWGVEYDPAIAAVAEANGFAPIVADVRSVDYAALPLVDWLHASPVCTRASNANPGAEESADDVEMAQAVVRALEAQQPQVFSLENVWMYRTFESFKRICAVLGDLGYMWDFEHVNAADFGVPQTRKRLILRAARGLLPPLPPPVRWVGWYAAIADLIPTLPESKLAPWQLARLPGDIRPPVLFDGDNSNSFTFSAADSPVFTMRSGRVSKHRAMLGARVVSMTPRALARFQSFPDSYILPERRTLAAKIIGNAVPRLLMQRIAEQMMEVAA